MTAPARHYKVTHTISPKIHVQCNIDKLVKNALLTNATYMWYKITMPHDQV